MELKYSENKIWLENEAGDMKAYVDFPETGTGRVNVTHTVVDPDLRGQGAAGKLMEALAGKLKEDGKKADDETTINDIDDNEDHGQVSENYDESEDNAKNDNINDNKYNNENENEDYNDEDEK